MTVLVEAGIPSNEQHKKFSKGNQPNDHLSTSIRIQFNTVKVQKNDSTLSELTCGSLDIRENLDIYSPVQWTISDEGCDLEWHQDGLICHCTHPGSYALLRWKTWEKVI